MYEVIVIPQLFAYQLSRAVLRAMVCKAMGQLKSNSVSEGNLQLILAVTEAYIKL